MSSAVCDVNKRGMKFLFGSAWTLILQDCGLTLVSVLVSKTFLHFVQTRAINTRTTSKESSLYVRQVFARNLEEFPTEQGQAQLDPTQPEAT